jgi:hypothetical protein
LVASVPATRLSSNQQNATSVSLLPPSTLDRLAGPAREAWSIDASPERQIDPASEKRYAYLAWNSVCAWLLPALEPGWANPDLYRALKYAQVTEGLEALERDALWTQYRSQDADVLVIGRWRCIAVMVAPGKPAEPFAACAGAQAVTPEPGETSWSAPPAEVRQALTALWDTYLTQKAATLAPTIERYYGFAAAKAKLSLGYLGGGTPSPDCLLFCDGQVVGILITKPPGIWHDYITYEFEPSPTQPPVTPLNRDLVLYEDTRLYRDMDDRWVSALDRATKRLVRLTSLGFPGAPVGTNVLFALPADGEVPASAWHTCELHFLAASLLEEARLTVGRALAAVDCPDGEGGRAPALRPEQRLPDMQAALSTWQQHASKETTPDQAVRAVTEALESSLTACATMVGAAASDRRVKAHAAADRARDLLTHAGDQLDNCLAIAGAKQVRSVYGAW